MASFAAGLRFSGTGCIAGALVAQAAEMSRSDAAQAIRIMSSPWEWMTSDKGENDAGNAEGDRKHATKAARTAQSLCIE
jgi:hypothetical protein